MKYSKLFSVMLLIFCGCAHVENGGALLSRVAVHEFDNGQQALSFFMEKRLLLQRLYQLTSEPYFGKPEKQECDNSIDVTAAITQVSSKKSYHLKMLANEEFALGDCLLRNNFYRVIYQYTLCSKRVKEEKHYFRLMGEYNIPEAKCD